MRVETRFVEEIAQEPRHSQWTVETLDEMFRRFGRVVRPLPDVAVRLRQSPADYLLQPERGQVSWQWELDPSAFRTSRWARAELGVEGVRSARPGPRTDDRDQHASVRSSAGVLIETVASRRK